MNLRSLVWKELRERPTAMLTGLLAIFLGVAALVAIRHITVFSEREVSQQLATLGANILILPKNASLQDYYSADLSDATLPESHASTVLMASLPGVEQLSPKYCLPLEFAGKQTILTGILPQEEFQAKSVWQSASMFTKTKHVGCAKADSCGPMDNSPESLATRRSIEKLDDNALILGADVAAASKLKSGSSTVLFGEQFRVVAVLPSTGTVDDGRIFGHLHTVQRLAKAGEVVSAIEVLGCCEDAAGQLVPQLSALLPDAKVVTISQVVQTQVGVNRLMAKTSMFVLGVLVLVGGASVASSTSANVRERRREIGTLMALGATPGLVARLFLTKAAWLGLVGGIAGVGVGVTLAIVIGPQWAGVAVSPLPYLAAGAVGAALVVALSAAFIPSLRAARLDPCSCFQDA
ncbi:MAG: ABC transporter permease [Planctomycetes bacterium]|nr:ABC transporter permease [Planctomycetota bacterium]